MGWFPWWTSLCWMHGSYVWKKPVYLRFGLSVFISGWWQPHSEEFLYFFCMCFLIKRKTAHFFSLYLWELRSDVYWSCIFYPSRNMHNSTQPSVLCVVILWMWYICWKVQLGVWNESRAWVKVLSRGHLNECYMLILMLMLNCLDGCTRSNHSEPCIYILISYELCCRCVHFVHGKVNRRMATSLQIEYFIKVQVLGYLLTSFRSDLSAIFFICMQKYLSVLHLCKNTGASLLSCILYQAVQQCATVHWRLDRCDTCLTFTHSWHSCRPMCWFVSFMI